MLNKKEKKLTLKIESKKGYCFYEPREKDYAILLERLSNKNIKIPRGYSFLMVDSIKKPTLVKEFNNKSRTWRAVR